jgi:hypothetical protein
MNYTDSILLQLASEATRNQLFDETALAQLASAAYRVDSLNLQGPYQAVFDQVTLGYSVPSIATFEGVWSPIGGVERTDAIFRLVGMADPVRVDALWQGGIVAHVSSMNSPIIDAQVQLDDINADTATEKVTVTYQAPAGVVQDASRFLPISAAVFIRDEGFSISELLIESKYAREQLQSLGLESAHDSDLPQKAAILLVWIIPDKVFNDKDWPGATPAERRQNAGEWLAREGIGLIAT